MIGSWTRWLLVVLGGCAMLAPGGGPGQPVHGLPLGPAGLLCAAAVLYAAITLPALGRVQARWLAAGFVLAIGLDLAAANIRPPVGLKASYWANATGQGARERSTDFPRLSDATRIDQSLDLRGEDFAVSFFNDAARFNFGPEVQPGRDQLPFSVRWEGFVNVPAMGERRIVVDSVGPTQVWLDEMPLAQADTQLNLSAGLHALRVDYLRPEARVPRLRLAWQRLPGGPLETLGGADVRWQANGASAEPARWAGLLADGVLVAVVLAWLALALAMARRQAQLGRAALAAVPLLFLIHGMLLHAPLIGRATILSGLDDWLIYESSARDILLNGLQMDGGQGHAPPFYGQPLYPYVLALAHRLTGESLFGPLGLQFAGLGTVLVGTAALARRAFDSRLAGLAALGGLWLLLQAEPEHFKVARQLFNENLYMPLVMASLIAALTLARRAAPPRPVVLVATGVLFGLTAIARSQFVLFVPFALLILLMAWRGHFGRAVPAAVCLIVGLSIAVAPVTLRNWLVSGQFVPISTSGGASLLEFHRPPPGLIDQTALDKDGLFQALHLDPQTRTVLAFVRADPGGYAATLLQPAAHSVGLQGRNDAGIYWPLLVTTLLYLAGFGLPAVRRLHVWPIHAFVATHLLVLVLFEADTYGYRLVMPMYAPMVVVAAQVVLAMVGMLARGRAGSFRLASGDANRAGRFATAGWSVVALAAVLWQARGLAEIWPQREPALHGLGGAAAQAAATADATGAEAIYVASIDGTPRRFGAGSLPGLRYPWFKWFDPARSVPMPPAATTAVYALSEVQGQSLPGDLVGCLGEPAAATFERVLAGAEVRQRCAAELPPRAPPITFDGLARIEALASPDTSQAGQPLETRVLWEPLVAHPDPQQLSLQLDDAQSTDSSLAGNGTLDVYPARQWEPGEVVLTRIAVATDATALPQQYRLTLGISPARPNAAPATAQWQGARTTRVPVGLVALTPGSAAAGQTLPDDMRAVEGPPLIDGGLELLAARPLPAEAAVGGSLKLGLLWRAASDAPTAADVILRLLRENGEVVQQESRPLLGGRIAPSSLRAGNVVRDEQTLLISSRAPTEVLWLEVGVLGERARLGSIKMIGRAHAYDASAQVQATFGSALELVGSSLEPAQARAGDKVVVKLRWRDAAEMQQAYKVFVHVLDQGGQQVVAQRDAEPQDGRAPTTGWVVGEVLDDEYAISLPPNLPAGEYPLEIGVYDPRGGSRLSLANTDNRLVLPIRLQVR